MENPGNPVLEQEAEMNCALSAAQCQSLQHDQFIAISIEMALDVASVRGRVESMNTNAALTAPTQAQLGCIDVKCKL